MFFWYGTTYKVCDGCLKGKKNGFNRKTLHTILSVQTYAESHSAVEQSALGLSANHQWNRQDGAFCLEGD